MLLYTKDKVSTFPMYISYIGIEDFPVSCYPPIHPGTLEAHHPGVCQYSSCKPCLVECGGH